jgi:hypothetical protein
MLIIHMAHYKLKMHACVCFILWHVYGYAFSNRQICIAWSIKNIFFACIFEFAQFVVVSGDECQKNIFLSLCECEIENRVGIAPPHHRWVNSEERRCELIYMHMSSAFVPDLFWVRLDLLIEWHFDISCILNVCRLIRHAEEIYSEIKFY